MADGWPNHRLSVPWAEQTTGMRCSSGQMAILADGLRNLRVRVSWG